LLPAATTGLHKGSIHRDRASDLPLDEPGSTWSG
jgi:hypothetical protein